jgi:hypothetical protein
MIGIGTIGTIRIIGKIGIVNGIITRIIIGIGIIIRIIIGIIIIKK